MSRCVWPAACVAAVLASVVPLTAQKAPFPAKTGLQPDILALACAPTATYSPAATPMRITGGQDAITHVTYAPGDLVTINAGTMNGMKVGQEFFIRRHQMGDEQRTGKDPVTVGTAGWLRVWAVDDAMSLATITHACGEIQVGDYLEPFALPAAVTPSSNTGKPERDHYAHVLRGDDLRSSFGRGDFFTIDRGSSEGVAVGARFVVYRDQKVDKNFLFELGEAVAVSVGPQVSTLRVMMSRDAFTAGDYVAERK